MNKEIKIGDIVESLQGHDLGNAYIVISIEKKNYVNIIDGKYRLIGNPKLKNPVHLKVIGHSDEILEKLNGLITNAELHKLIKNLKE